MRVELRAEARHNLLEGAWFDEQQREGLGDYFTDRLFEDLDRLESEAGIHAGSLVFLANCRSGFHLPSTTGSRNR